MSSKRNAVNPSECENVAKMSCTSIMFEKMARHFLICVAV